jgi:hypothetical protein
MQCVREDSLNDDYNLNDSMTHDDGLIMSHLSNNQARLETIESFLRDFDLFTDQLRIYLIDCNQKLNAAK